MALLALHLLGCMDVIETRNDACAGRSVGVGSLASNLPASIRPSIYFPFYSSWLALQAPRSGAASLACRTRLLYRKVKTKANPMPHRSTADDDYSDNHQDHGGSGVVLTYDYSPP